MRTLIIFFFTTAIASAIESTPSLAEREYNITVEQAKLAMEQKIKPIQAEYEAKVKAAKEKLSAALSQDLQAAMKSGNPEEAVHIKAKIESLKNTGNDKVKLFWIEAAGEYKTKYGVVTLSYQSDNFNLKEASKKGTNQSLSWKIIDNDLYFKWSNGNDCIVLSYKDNNFIFSCYSGSGDKFDQITNLKPNESNIMKK